MVDRLKFGSSVNGCLLDESVGNGLCAVPPSPRNLHGTLNGKRRFPVELNHIPFNQAVRPVGWVPLRGWNGTQAVPYEMDDHVPFDMEGALGRDWHFAGK